MSHQHKNEETTKMGVILVIAMLTYMKETEVARFLIEIDGTEG